MFDPTFIPPSPPASAQFGKHSRINIASFVIGILVLLIFCVTFIVAFGDELTMAFQNPSCLGDIDK